MQPQICIKLTEKQKRDIVYAIHNLTGVTLNVDPKQIDVNGDWINVSKSQANHIYKSLTKNKPFNLTFSKAQLQKMRKQIGEGILDSIGNFFKGGYNSAKNFIAPKQQPRQDINKGWTMVDKNLGKTNKDLSKRYNAVEMKNMANIKPKYVDYGPEYDHMPPGYVPPKKTGFDAFAEKVSNFDKGIKNVFGYSNGTPNPKPSVGYIQNKPKAPLPNAWKEQALKYNNMGFLKENF